MGGAFVIMAGGMLLCVIVMMAILISESKRGPMTSQAKLASQAKKFHFFYDNFLTRKAFRHLVEQIASLSIYNLVEIQKLAIKYYTRAVGMSALFVVLGYVVFRDVTAMLLCFGFAMILYDTLIRQRINDTHFAVVKELSNVLASIRDTYTLMGNIPDAIGECDKGVLLQKVIDKIYIILTATDRDERLEDFYRTVPFPMLQTLAGVCALLNDAGDEVDEKGVSAFKSAVTLLKHECDLEVRKLTKQRVLFGSLKWLPIVPLPAIGLLQVFFVHFMPGTSVIYNGMVGYIVQTLTILVAIVAYWYISTATDQQAIRRDDRSIWIEKFAHWEPVKRILPDILPKKQKVRNKLRLAVAGALSHKDINYIYASKLLAAAVTFLLSIFALTTFTFLAKEFSYNNVQSMSLTSSMSMTVEDERRWREVDAEILAAPKLPSDNAIMEVVSANFGGLSSMDKYDQVQRIISKYNTYHNLSFHWWYVFVAFALAVVAWFAPPLMIKTRRKLVRAEEEEDVLQLQTMLSILRHTQLDTMEALYWLAKQSRIYQTSIYFAYHEYASDPEQALMRLQSKSQLPEFRQICNRLLTTVSSITLREAFSDLESERDQMLSIREIIQNNLMEKKRRSCSMPAKFPIYAVVVGQVIIPIALLVVSEGTRLFTQLGVAL